MAEPKTEVDRRMDRHEKAIRRLAELAGLEQYRKEIEDILDGIRTETTSEDSPSTAD